jgi:hypothetical protein
MELTVVRIIAVLVGLMILINSLVMLVSPRLWFSLPSYVRVQGLWFEAKSPGRENFFHVRLTGGFLLAFTICIVVGLSVLR